ncbi:MEDS domain-containing protein [Actinoplanes sp. NPDC026619]|uniref:MEDS domain-containing protein n=1 Tax=Actinoplanes sp. NPDC026619 TaxID=3155798 RepID=UPI00340F827D
MTTNLAPDFGHACWSYDDYSPFDRYAGEFLHAGLAAGERVWYVTGRSAGATAEWLRGVGTAARVVSTTDAYVGTDAIDPAEQMATYTAVTEQALAEGFTGFRVAADVTAMVRTGEQRDAFARYEYSIGRYMKIAPMSAVCAYDRVELGDEVVAELACLHETSHAAGVTFQLHAGPTRASAVLSGELDMAAEDLFTAALHRTDLEPVGGEVLVDADDLHFIDHRSLQTLQRFAETKRMTAVLRTRLGVAARIAALLDLPGVRVEITR